MERYQRRTARLTSQIGGVVRELAGRAGSRVLAGLGVSVSRQVALRVLLNLPLPARPVPQVIGVDDFALRKRRRYATVIINAQTRERIDVLPDRTAEGLHAWLSGHLEVDVVCRDGSATYAEAIRRALPEVVQVADRWHIWHNLAETACHEMTTLTDLVRAFVALLTPTTGNDDLLTTWIDQAQQADLPHLNAFTRGLEFDSQAVNAALTQPFHNGGTQGVNNKTILWNQNCQGWDALPCWTSMIGSRVAFAGTLIWRGVDPAGCGSRLRAA